jgi:hypothetical protein
LPEPLPIKKIIKRIKKAVPVVIPVERDLIDELLL